MRITWDAVKKSLYLLSALLLIFMLYFSQFRELRNSSYLFNADFLHIVFFSESLVSNIQNTAHWYTTPSPYLFPDVALFACVDAITTSPKTTYVIILWLNFLLFNLGIHRLQTLFFRPSIGLLILFNGLIFVLFYFNTYEYFLYLHQFAPVNHLSAFICFCFMFKREIKWNWRTLIWVLGIVLFGASDPVFLLYFLPVQAALLFKSTSMIKTAVPILAGLLGGLLFKLSYACGLLKSANDQTHVSRDILLSFQNFFQDIGHMSSSLTFWLLGILFLLSLLWSKVTHKFILYYIVFGVPLIICFLGFIQGPDTFRYFTGSLFFGAFLGFSFLLNGIKMYLEKITIKAEYGFIFPALSIAVFAYATTIGFFAVPPPPYVNCVEAFARQHKTNLVIADYWSAKPLRFFTEHLQVFPVTDGLSPNFHETDIRCFDTLRNQNGMPIIAYTSSLNMDSLNAYRNFAIPTEKCFQDSLMILYKNPLSTSR